MKLVLDIQNSHRKQLPSKKYLAKYILDILKEKNMLGDFEIALMIVSKKEIKDLNYKFLKRDFPTDVLSFPIYDKPPAKSSMIILLGDIFICYKVMLENALKYNRKPQEELLFLIRHSVLHLLGSHHK